MPYPKIIFPTDWTERDEAEMVVKGCVELDIELSNGKCYQLSFYDPIRLNQTVERSLQRGGNFFAEANLIVLSSVTLEHIQIAIEELSKGLFFTYLKPLELDKEKT